MTQKCLLIKTKDNRKFLTHEKNLNSLIEFSKTFGAEIFTVPIAQEFSILELKDLVAALCNPQYVNCQEFSEAEAGWFFRDNSLGYGDSGLVS